MRSRMLRIFPFICVLLFSIAASAQDELTREERFQRDLIARGLMAITGVEAVAFDLEGEDSYVRVYLNESKLQASNAGMATLNRVTLRTRFTDLMAAYDIKTYAEESIVEFSALQAQIGTSTSNDTGCGAGTLGIVAIDANSVKGYLTNSHVAAARGRSLCVNGTEKDQVAPARLDSPHCHSTTKIGDLAAATHIEVKKLKPGAEVTTKADAAFVAEIAGQIDPKNACNLCTDKLSIVAATASMELLTCGRRNTTATKGRVKDPKVLAWVRFPCGVRALFESQILVEDADANYPFTRPGYSGAVAYRTISGQLDGVVGLIFARDRSVGLTLMNPMQTALDELKAANNNVEVKIDTARHCR